MNSFYWLPWKDSNSHKRNQNPVCYHYTTRQFFVLSPGLFPFDDAKLVLFLELTKYLTNFFCNNFALFI